MQSVKMLLRQVGNPTGDGQIISSQELEEYIKFNFTSNGYEVNSTHYLGEVKDHEGNTQGYKVLLWFAKNEAEAKQAVKPEAK